MREQNAQTLYTRMSCSMYISDVHIFTVITYLHVRDSLIYLRKLALLLTNGR